MKESGTLSIYAGQKGAELGDLFGIFFEDLNHAADGGLYAELVRNRSFEFDPIDRGDYHALTAWEKIERGNGRLHVSIEEGNPIHERNPHYAVLDIIDPGDGVGLMNLGFNTGIPIREGESYRFSVYARREGSHDHPIRIALESKDGRLYGQTEIMVVSDEWRKYEATIAAGDTDYGGRLTIVTARAGKLCLDMVSLFPAHTYRGRSNGLRTDIANIIAELKPKFMRFPGGCLVHDGSLNADDRNSMYRWKNTLGPVETRPPRRNNWGYNQTLGLGYYEYFQFCEDIGAKPIPILPAGYDPHHKRIVPLGELQLWIDDALDLIEFARGDAATKWGAVRAELGHPEPFGLEYIGIGNEEVGEPFFERYAYFHRAIKAKYPDIHIINSSGPFAAGGEYERGWKSARDNGSDYVDEHYYMAPEWLLAHIDRYDGFKADEPKVFLGEYASWGNTYYNALAEAAFMTGLERNAHAVGLACYAPMLCNADYVNWKPDMIWFNNHQVYGTPNYYVQKLFMHHQGDRLLKIEAEGFPAPQAASAEPPIVGRIYLGADSCRAVFRNIRLTDHATGEATDFEGAEASDTAEDRERGQAHPFHALTETAGSHYTLRMTAVKVSGPKGFVIKFGHKDDRNGLKWEIGGWQNQDAAVVSTVNGRGSCLTQSLFTVEEGREYELELEIEGRKIRTRIDGVTVNETEDRLPVIQPLYVSSSIEESTGDIIVKAVNVQDREAAAEIVWEDVRDEAAVIEVHELSGHGLDEENSFENPERIVPRSFEQTVQGNRMNYTFPNHSVTIIRRKALK